MVTQPECDILIYYAHYGSGHIQVASALTQALLQLDPGLTIRQTDPVQQAPHKVVRWFNHLYNRLFFVVAPFYRAYYTLTRRIRPGTGLHRLLMGQMISEDDLMSAYEQYRPRLIVNTFPMHAACAGYLKGNGTLAVPQVTIVTDPTVHPQWLHPSVDCLCLPCEWMLEPAASLGIPHQALRATGIPIRQAFQDIPDRDIYLRSMGLDPTLPILLVSGGGNGLLGSVYGQIKRLCRDARDIQIVVAAGDNPSIQARFAHLKRVSRVPFFILGYIDSMPALMRCATLMLGKAGGITIFEALAAQLPMLIFKPLPGHEQANLRFLKSAGLAIHIRRYAQLNRAIEELSHPCPRRDELLARMRAYARPDAAHAAAQEILRILNAQTEAGQ